MTPLFPPPVQTGMLAGGGNNPAWSGWFVSVYEWITNALQFVEVADIDDPSAEMASMASNREGGLCVANEQAVGWFSIYAWSTAALAASAPTVITGNGGWWVLVATGGPGGV